MDALELTFDTLLVGVFALPAAIVLIHATVTLYALVRGGPGFDVWDTDD